MNKWGEHVRGYKETSEYRGILGIEGHFGIFGFRNWKNINSSIYG